MPELVPRNTPITLDGNWNWKQGNFFLHKGVNQPSQSISSSAVVSFSFSAYPITQLTPPPPPPPFQEQRVSFIIIGRKPIIPVWVDLCIYASTYTVLTSLYASSVIACNLCTEKKSLFSVNPAYPSLFCHLPPPPRNPGVMSDHPPIKQENYWYKKSCKTTM